MVSKDRTQEQTLGSKGAFGVCRAFIAEKSVTDSRRSKSGEDRDLGYNTGLGLIQTSSLLQWVYLGQL